MESRSEIKRNYKLTHPPMGVYQIKNLLDDSIYIGSSQNLNGIFNRHKFELKFGSHKIKVLQESWNKYGESGVVFEILDQLEPKEDATYNYTKDISTLEELWLEKLANNGNKYFPLFGTAVKE
ncbi:MAG: GIY-YIG nuclease family protein [Ignavibacteriales bacterium]|nr:GIY-YIG nuclease family protein [Ignavibacteriales bacterium]